MAESHFQFQQLKTLRKSPHSPWKQPLFMAYLSHLPNHNFKFAFSKSSTISFGRCSLSHRRTAILDLPFRPLVAAARPRTLCKMSDSGEQSLTPCLSNGFCCLVALESYSLSGLSTSSWRAQRKKEVGYF